MKPAVIAPSILSADWLHLEDAVRSCELAGADWLHVDVMDGRFVPNLTMGPFIVEALRRATRLPLDVHLMTEEPERLLKSFVDAGASRLTVHVEACPRLADTVAMIQGFKCEAGVTLRPATPVGALDTVLPAVDLVLVMSVNPGYAGQEFIQGSVERATEVRHKLDALRSKAWLEVDGGINAKTAAKMRAAGADAFVAASAVFQHPDGIAAGIHALRSATGDGGP